MPNSSDAIKHEASAEFPSLSPLVGGAMASISPVSRGSEKGTDPEKDSGGFSETPSKNTYDVAVQ